MTNATEVIPAAPAPGVVGPGMRVVCEPGSVPGYRHMMFGVIVSVGPKHTRVIVSGETKPRPIPNDKVTIDPIVAGKLQPDPRNVELPHGGRHTNARGGHSRWLPYWSWLRWTIAQHQEYARGERPLEDAPTPAPKRLVIVSCGGVKREHPTDAHNLYIGNYFKAARRAADALIRGENDYQVILSAKYGLLDLHDVIAPYEMRMGQPGAVSVDTIAYQAGQLGLVDTPEVIVLAGRAYADVVTAVWPHARRPLDGTAGIGEQLHRLAGVAAAGVLPAAVEPARPADPWADLFEAA